MQLGARMRLHFARALIVSTMFISFIFRLPAYAAKQNVILFVHGFGGNSTTWKNPNSKRSWPDLIKSDTNFHNFDVDELPYKSNCSPDDLIIEKVASGQLIPRLKDLSTKADNIFIIAHSMGGLITTSALSLLYNSDRNLYDKVKGVFLYAVPFQGINESLWVNISGLFCHDKNIGQLQYKNNASYLTRLLNEWKIIKVRKSEPFPMFYNFIETQGEPIVGILVDTKDSFPYTYGYDILPYEKAHTMIVKPKNRHDEVYKRTSSLIQEVLHQIDQHQPQVLYEVPERNSKIYFQLINMLESQLNDTNTIVKQMVRMKDDTTNELKVIPILIEKSIGVHRITVAIEVMTSTQPANTQEIEAMVGKYNSLPIDKVVIVGIDGFSATARKKADSLKYELLTLQEGLNKDWAKIVNNITDVRVQTIVQPTIVSVTLEVGTTNYNHPLDQKWKNATMIDSTGESIGSVTSWVQSIYTQFVISTPIAKSMFDFSNDSGSYTSLMYFQFPEGNKVVLGTTSLPLSAIGLKINYTQVIQDIPLTKATYGDSQIRYGSKKILGQEHIVAITEKQGDSFAKFGVSVEKSSNIISSPFYIDLGSSSNKSLK